MLRKRVVPVLTIRNGKVVKTVKFKNDVYIGDPINAVRIFNQKEVDEIFILDIGASVTNDDINFELVKKLASECFMPVCYGGGIKRLEDIKKLFKIGVDKVLVGTSMFSNPELIRESVDIYGAQSIVGNIDVKKSMFFKRQSVFVKSGKRRLKMSPQSAAEYAVNLGVGELVVNSIDRDGTWQGYDIDLLNIISSSCEIPVVSVGGAGKISDIVDAFNVGVSAAALGSMSVFQSKGMGVLIKFPFNKEVEKVLCNE